MSFTERMTEKISIPAASLPPANRTAANYTVGPIEAKEFRRLMAHVNAGVIGGGNIVAFFQESAENNANFANITGGGTLTISASNKESTLEIRSDQLGAGKKYVQLVLTLNTGPANCAAAVFGGDAHYSPASDFDDTGLVTRVVT